MRKSWKLAGGLFGLLAVAGCLPPVEEVNDNTPNVAEASAASEASGEASSSNNEGSGSVASSSTTGGGNNGHAAGEFQTTASGLQYLIVKPGSSKKPTARDTVLCHYKGWLDDGTQFDSSYDRGEPIDFPLNGVIGGWTEGLQLIGEGGEIELIIPSSIGYGARGMPPVIPGNATLHFKVELLKVM
ncbi:MAG: FKBP-type peptidyl-prolyl cis-trans isomerase [Planctomycetaceae bacterium]